MLSLRARLLAGLLVLVLGGLVAANIATYSALQSFLYARVDDQLLAGRDQALHALLAQAGIAPQGGEPSQPGGGGGPGGPPGPSLPGGTYAALITSTGEVLSHQTLGFEQSGSSARPVLPQPLPDRGPGTPTTSSVEGTGGVASYRLLIEALRQPPGDFLVIATPLNDVGSTLQRMLLLEVSIGAAVVVGMMGLGFLIIRLGLRPLERMSETAAAFAAGDLGRRVEPATSKTEIGRLGLALNTMLTQIEAAFAERTEAVERLRRFLASASHELRTPLTSIRGYAEMLRRGAERSPEDAALARRRIESEAIRMSTLVDEMLLLSRLDRDRAAERLPVDLREILLDAAADARAVAPDRRISVQADRPAVVTGDEMRLRQAIGNLLRNALVHTPTGTAIETSLVCEEGRARLAVVDHGPGVPLHAASRVFEPFYRADPGRSRDHGGSGLGLPIVAAVITAHGGEAGLAETPGGGATFTVDLPLAPEA